MDQIAFVLVHWAGIHLVLLEGLPVLEWQHLNLSLCLAALTLQHHSDRQEQFVKMLMAVLKLALADAAGLVLVREAA